MTTTEIALLIVLISVIIGIGFLVRLFFRGGSNLNLLEDELFPECECRNFINKKQEYFCGVDLASGKDYSVTIEFGMKPEHLKPVSIEIYKEQIINLSKSKEWICKIFRITPVRHRDYIIIAYFNESISLRSNEMILSNNALKWFVLAINKVNGGMTTAVRLKTLIPTTITNLALTEFVILSRPYKET